MILLAVFFSFLSTMSSSLDITWNYPLRTDVAGLCPICYIVVSTGPMFMFDLCFLGLTQPLPFFWIVMSPHLHHYSKVSFFIHFFFIKKRFECFLFVNIGKSNILLKLWRSTILDSIFWLYSRWKPHDIKGFSVEPPGRVPDETLIGWKGTG